jgi:hypothetical protein
MSLAAAELELKGMGKRGPQGLQSITNDTIFDETAMD